MTVLEWLGAVIAPVSGHAEMRPNSVPDAGTFGLGPNGYYITPVASRAPRPHAPGL